MDRHDDWDDWDDGAERALRRLLVFGGAVTVIVGVLLWRGLR